MLRNLCSPYSTYRAPAPAQREGRSDVDGATSANAPRRHAELIDAWAHWANDARCGDGEQRDVALARLRDCLQTDYYRLSLFGLGLTTLPACLPPNLRDLDVSDNRLARLPEHLPDGLRRLEASQNCLRTLPTVLPAALECLCAHGNQLSELPSTLPGQLRYLSVWSNPLTSLPADLPAGLEFLNISHTSISELPSRLPDSLEELMASFCGLRVLPDPLPQRLRSLETPNNHLTRLPSALPPSLAVLDIAYNQLTALPNVIPPSLERLEAYSNRLTALPESLLDLPRSASVVVTGNPLSDATIRALRETPRDPSRYVSVQYAFERPRLFAARQAPSPWAPLVALWCDAAPDAPIVRQWETYADEANSQAFARFLHRLSNTVGASAADFQARMAEWLAQLSTSRSLREQTFLIAHHATESCDDSIAMTHAQMQAAALAHQAGTSEYFNQLPAMVAAGRELFRLEALAKIAHQTVRALESDDEIEVYLAFQTGLRETLDLRTACSKMRFGGISGVTHEHLRDATLQVRAREQREFADWLMRWVPWQRMLRSAAPARFDRAAEGFEQAMTSEHARRVEQRLADSRLHGIPDAEAVIGKQEWDRLLTRKYRALNREFLLEKYLQKIVAHAPKQSLEALAELVDIAAVAPAVVGRLMTARNTRGEHLGSRIAGIVMRDTAAPLADAYFSLLRVLHADGELRSNALIDALLCHDSDSRIPSLAHTVAAKAWASPAALMLCSLLAELAQTDETARAQIVASLRGGQATSTNTIRRMLQRADFLTLAARADRVRPNPPAVALLRDHGLLPAGHPLRQRPSAPTGECIERDRDCAALSMRIRADLSPKLAAAGARNASERCVIA